MQTNRVLSVFRLFVVTVAALVVAPVSAQAAPDNARFVADLLVKAQFEQSTQATRKQMPQLMAQIAQQVATVSGDSAAGAESIRRLERMQPLQEKMLDRLAAELARPDIRNQLSDAAVASLKRVYSPAEIDSLADYYRTPLGAAVIAKQATLMGDLLPATTAITMQVMQPAMAEFMEGAKKLAAEDRASKAK